VKRALAFFLFSFCGCAFLQEHAKDALDVATIACIIANASSDDATVQRVCRIVDEAAPAMKDVLKSHRAAAARYAAEHKGDCR